VVGLIGSDRTLGSGRGGVVGTDVVGRRVSASDRSSSAILANRASDGYSTREAASSSMSEGNVSPALDGCLEDRMRRVRSDSLGSGTARGSSVGGSIRALVALEEARIVLGVGPSEYGSRVTPEEMLEGLVVTMSKSGRNVVSSPDTGYGNRGLLDAVDAGNPVKASNGSIEAVVVVGRDPVLGGWADKLIKSPAGPEMPMSCCS
jgi:hypothetical protein